MTLSSSALAAGWRILQPSPFTLALLWSNSWLFLGCLWRRARNLWALTQPGSTQVQLQSRGEQPPSETLEFASSTSPWRWEDVEHQEAPEESGKPCTLLARRSDTHLLRELSLLEQRKSPSCKLNQAQGMKWQQQLCYTFLSSKVFQILITALLLLLRP